MHGKNLGPAPEATNSPPPDAPTGPENLSIPFIMNESISTSSLCHLLAAQVLSFSGEAGGGPQEPRSYRVYAMGFGFSRPGLES